MRLFPHAICLLVLALCACTATAPTSTSPSGHRLTSTAHGTPTPEPSTEVSPSNATSASPTVTPGPAFGLVLDTSGQPAVGVPVTGYLLSNNGGGLISDKGGSIIGNNGSSYRLLDAALTATTDAQGHFTLHDPQGRPLDLEAVANPETKAIALNIASDATGVTLHLAPTGTLTGTVTASDTAVTNLIGVDVFVPGTSYQAQTDSAGHFTIAQMPQGTFQLYATKTGVGQALVSGAVVKSGQSTTAPPIVLVPSIPTIQSLSVHDGAAGSAVTITGTKFGSSEGRTFSVSLGGAQVTNPDRVDDQTIKIQVPQGAHTGDLTVTVDGISSASQHFRVWSSLAIGTQLRYLPQGRAIPFRLDAVDTDGVHAATATVDWSASGTATVDASGTVTMGGTGSATLSARCGALTAPVVTLTGVGATPAVNTIAGNAQSAFLDGVGGNAEFYFPRSLTIGPDGNLYVADEWNSAIRKVTPGGTVTTLVGKDSSGQSPLSFPVGIATGPDGNLYVADENGGDVAKVTLAGQVTTIASIDAVKTAQSATSTYLGGIAVAADGTLYVSDTWNNDVLKIQGGQVTVLAGNDSFAGGSADGQGNQASFKTPQGLALDGQGNLFVADNGNNALRKIQLSTGQVGTLTLSGAQLTTPYGLALDKQGNLYTANQMGGQVLEITPQGVVSVLAGSGSFVTLADGPVSSAGFGYTFGLCFDPQGDLYVTEGSDGNVNRLREILMP